MWMVAQGIPRGDFPAQDKSDLFRDVYSSTPSARESVRGNQTRHDARRRSRLTLDRISRTPTTLLCRNQYFTRWLSIKGPFECIFSKWGLQGVDLSVLIGPMSHSRT